MSFHSAAVRHAWDETRELRGLKLEVPIELARAHVAPGQYMKLRTDAGEGFFALAAPPGGGAEFLVKRGSALGDALAGLDEGAAIEVSEVQGKGFPVDTAEGRDLIFVAVGSGITPVRAAIAHALARRDRFGRLLLLYGQRSPDAFAYAGDLPAWEGAGLEVVRVVSRPEGTSWSGARGYVQEALAARRPEVARASAFLCGMKPMVQAVTDGLMALGMERDRVHLNY
jgi:ferredoxin-NADP reductase